MTATIKAPIVQAVLLTVPHFPMHRQDIRVFTMRRRAMSPGTFKNVLTWLVNQGLVQPARSLTGARMKDHFQCDPLRLLTHWRQRGPLTPADLC